MFFMLFAMVIAVSCTTLTVKTLVGYSNIPLLLKLLIGILITISWFAPPIVGFIRYNYSNVGFLGNLSYVLYYLFGLVFILFMLLLFRDFIWYLSFYGSKLLGFKDVIVNPRNLHWLNITNIVAIILSVLISLYALYEGVRLPRIKEVEIYSPKVDKEFRVALLTDLHFVSSTKVDRVKSIVTRVNSLDADVVVLGGDLVDDIPADLIGQIEELKNFESTYGTYIVHGNHEVYRGLGPWTLKFRNLGGNVKFLANETINLPNNITLVGIYDKAAYGNFPPMVPDFSKLLSSVSKANYRILLSHSPHIIDDLTIGDFDLQLSGHTHGGQIFPFHLLAKLDNGYISGLYDVNETKLYISRGAGLWGPPLRLFAPSEITLIRIKPENNLR